MSYRFRVVQPGLLMPALLVFFLACESEPEVENRVADADPGATGSGDGSVDAAVPVVVLDGAVIDAVDATPVVVGRSLYVSPTGVDSNEGTKESPLRSIITSVDLAEAGDTVWLLDGTYDKTTDKTPAPGMPAPCGQGFGVVVPSGVTVRAVNPGAVIVSVGGWIGFCLQGGTVRDIDFNLPPNGGVMLQTQSGDSTIEGVTFDNLYCGGGSGWEAAIMTKGSSRLTINPGRVQNYVGLKGCAFLTIWDQSSVTVMGGAIDGGEEGTSSGNAFIIIRDAGKLNLVGTRLATQKHLYGIHILGTAELTTSAGTTLSGFLGSAIVARSGQTRVTLAGTTFTANNTAVLQPFGYGGPGTIMRIKATDCTLSDNSRGFSSGYGYQIDLDIVNCKLLRNADALLINAQGTVSVVDSEITGMENGINVTPQSKCALSVRNTTISDTNHGVTVNCDATSTIDLGTLGSPGANTFAAKTANLRALGVGPVIDAIGNTWTASAQGADLSGKYQAQGAGAILEVTGGSGPNYTLGTIKARLAQNN